MSSLTPGDAQEPPAHPLAQELATQLTGRHASRALLLGIGSGRNLAPLLAADLRVDVVEDDAERARSAAARFAADPRVRVVRARYAGPYPFAGGAAGALSTHALLHGSIASIEAALAAIANRLARGGLLFATFGSTRDPRFAAGLPREPFVSEPREGNERGVPHAYFDRARLYGLLRNFSNVRCDEGSAAESAGRWAHDPSEAANLVHWFVRAVKG